MATIATSMLAQAPQLRPLNILRDLPAVADLVESCFASTMDSDGRDYIQQMRRAGHDNAFLRWANNAVESASMPLSGYVWVENQEIIGNVSLIPYRFRRRKYYLIANVAVRPEFRRRGVGRALTLAGMQHARQHRSDETWLQVRADNPGAIELYRSLGFTEITRRTTWQVHPGSQTRSQGIKVFRRIARDWPIQENWLGRSYPEIISWYQPLPWLSLRPGIGPAFYRFMADENVRHWVARTDRNPTAILSWQRMAGNRDRLWAAVPAEGGEPALTNLLLHALQQLSGREKLSLDFPTGQYNTSIQAAGFSALRTLLWMRLDETLSGNERKAI